MTVRVTWQRDKTESQYKLLFYSQEDGKTVRYAIKYFRQAVQLRIVSAPGPGWGFLSILTAISYHVAGSGTPMSATWAI